MFRQNTSFYLPAFEISRLYRKIRLIESNAKCRVRCSFLSRYAAPLELKLCYPAKPQWFFAEPLCPPHTNTILWTRKVIQPYIYTWSGKNGFIVQCMVLFTFMAGCEQTVLRLFAGFSIWVRQKSSFSSLLQVLVLARDPLFIFACKINHRLSFQTLCLLKVLSNRYVEIGINRSIWWTVLCPFQGTSGHNQEKSKNVFTFWHCPNLMG